MNPKTTEKHVIKSYQCDRYGNIRPVMLMNELQGIADRNANYLGAGRDYCVANGIAWVVTHYLVDIIKLPTAGQELEFSTWSYGHTDLRAIREFEIRDSSGNVFVRATSQWVLIDLNTRRPIRISEKLPNWKHIEQRALERKFEKCSDFIPEVSHEFKCRYDDIDLNQHINNAVYAIWATESVGFEFRDTHELKGMDIYFEHEISPDTKIVKIDVKLEPHKTYHKISTYDKINAHVICYWN